MGWAVLIFGLFAILRVARVAGSSGVRTRKVKKFDEAGNERIEVWQEQTSSLFERVAARVFMIGFAILVVELLRELHVIPTPPWLHHWLAVWLT